jgi:hypothetical protein
VVHLADEPLYSAAFENSQERMPMAFDVEQETRRHWEGWQSFIRLTLIAAAAAFVVVLGLIVFAFK